MSIQHEEHETLDFSECFAGEPAEGGIADDIARAEEAQQRRRHTVGAVIGGVAVMALSLGFISGLPGASSVSGQPDGRQEHLSFARMIAESSNSRALEVCLTNVKIHECVFVGPAKITIRRESPGTKEQAEADKRRAENLRKEVDELNKRAANGEKIEAEFWLDDGVAN